MEKLENKLVDMRDMYQEYKERLISGRVSITVCTMVAHSTQSFIACDVTDAKLTPFFFSLFLSGNNNISMLIVTLINSFFYNAKTQKPIVDPRVDNDDDEV